MNAVAANRPDGQASVPKRPKRSRILVLGGLLLLLLIIVMEWRSDQGYTATFAELDQSLQVNPIPIPELSNHVHGFAFRNEQTVGDKRRITLQWPSLYKQLKLELAVKAADQVVSVKRIEVEDKADNQSLIPSRFATQSTRQPGLPEGYEKAVVLTTSDLNMVRGLVIRELFRQALLIAAQDDLGLPTLDPSLGDTIPLTDSPRSYPFSANLLIESSIVESGEIHSPNARIRFKVKPTVSRPAVDGVPFNWTGQEITIPAENAIEAFAKQMSELSAGPFVEMWRKAGYQNRARHDDSGRRQIADADERLDFLSQFALLRELHAQIRESGSAPETTGRLVRVYANLGNLTEYHWNSQSKAFKARGLLYAQRLIAQSGQTPFALAHWAYALAMTGRHASALQAAHEAKSAKGNDLPAWLPLIEAYCEFDRNRLDQIDGPLRELALYLRMRTVDATGDQAKSLEVIQQFSESNPASFRAAESVGEMRALGIQRMLTEGGYDAMWPAIYARLAEFPDLPVGAVEIATAESKQVNSNPQSEQQSRVRLMNELHKAATNPALQDFPSWTVLESMFRELSFIQAWRTLNVETNMLGVDTGPSLNTLKPLYQDDPRKDFLDSYSSNIQEARQAFTKFLDKFDGTLFDAAAEPMSEMRMARFPEIKGKNFSVISLHRDDIFEDARRGLNRGAFSFPLDRLLEISPHCPQIVASNISRTSEFDRHAREWERQFATNPEMLRILGERHEQNRKFPDAIRCLNKSIELSPSIPAYKVLARAYKKQGDLINWQDALDRAIELPNFGLETAAMQVEVAETFMGTGDWKKAEPYAMAAAQSGAGWAMETAARCAERLENWELAEALMRDRSKGYQDFGADWYFWCVRTGRGNAESARQLAEESITTLSAPLNHDQTWHQVTWQILNEDLEGALATFQENRNHSEAIHFKEAYTVYGAILADVLGKTEIRDSLLSPFGITLGYVHSTAGLANMLLGELSGTDQGRWNAKEFERVVSNALDSEIPNFYYFASLFADKHGQPELAREYLQCAATAVSGQRPGCILANRVLRSRNIDPGPQRLNLLADALADLDTRLTDVIVKSETSPPEEIEQLLNQAVTLHPDLVSGYLARAAFYERREDYQKAIAEYERALTIDPRCYSAYLRLAFILAGCDQDQLRDGQKALKMAERAAALRFYPTARAQFALSAANSELGRFKQAVDISSGTLRLVDPEPFDGQVDRYKQSLPYRLKRLHNAEPAKPNTKK